MHTHHLINDFVTLARHMSRQAGDIHVLGHDLLNAYRQWPVKHPGHSATFLATDYIMTLWFHVAMCFGATASVWNFNRAADALQLITRVLLLLMGGHYVDDFNALKYEEAANSAFNAFAEVFDPLGLRIKASKDRAQHANTSSRVSALSGRPRSDSGAHGTESREDIAHHRHGHPGHDAQHGEPPGRKTGMATFGLHSHGHKTSPGSVGSPTA